MWKAVEGQESASHLREGLDEAVAERGDDEVELGVIGIHRDDHAVEEAEAEAVPATWQGREGESCGLWKQAGLWKQRSRRRRQKQYVEGHRDVAKGAGRGGGGYMSSKARSR